MFPPHSHTQKQTIAKTEIAVYPMLWFQLVVAVMKVIMQEIGVKWRPPHCISETCAPLLLPTHLYKDFAQTQNMCQQNFWLQCVSKTCTPLLLSTSLHWDFEQTINPCQQSFCYNVPVISHIYTIAATRKSAPWLHKRLKPKPTQFSATLCQ